MSCLRRTREEAQKATHKRCSVCKEMHSLDEFSNWKSSIDGKSYTCEACARQYFKAHRADYKRRAREHYQRNRASIIAKTCRIAREQPEKHRARAQVRYRKKQGQLEPKPCATCGASNNITVAHHEDYSAPLDVVWLCPKCHWAIHHKDVGDKAASG